MIEKALIPQPIRKLRAAMEIAGLSVRQVSARSGVEYTQTSGILTGRLRYPAGLNRIESAIFSALADAGEADVYDDSPPPGFGGSGEEFWNLLGIHKPEK